MYFTSPKPFAPPGCENADLHLLAHYLVDRPYRTYSAALSGRRVLILRTTVRLRQLYKTLRPWRLHFGNRTVEEICVYIAYAADFCDQAVAADVDLEGYNLTAAFDRQVLQKVLPRVSGTREELQDSSNGNLFVNLRQLLERFHCTLSLRKLARMQAQEIVNFWEA